jgi:large subunit ribosomal protein L15
LPKRGFKNPFSKDYAELTLASLERAITSGKIDPKEPINEELLRTIGVVRKSSDGIRLLATGELRSKVSINVTGATKGAIAAVEKMGGTINITPIKPKPEGKGKARHRKFKEGNTKTTSATSSSDVKNEASEPKKKNLKEDAITQDEDS